MESVELSLLDLLAVFTFKLSPPFVIFKTPQEKEKNNTGNGLVSSNKYKHAFL